MFSLTSTAFFTKKFLIGILVLLAIVVTYLMLSSTGKKLYQTFFPNPDPSLVAFGKLPELDISEGIKPQANIAYKVDTVSGQLDELSRELKVFTVKQGVAAFGDIAKANEIAKSKNFQVPAGKVDGGFATYTNTDKNNLNLTLSIELATKNLLLSSDYLNNQNVITSQPKGEIETLKIANDFLKNQKLPENEFPTNKVSYIKFKVDNGRLVEALSLSNANLMQINYNRSEIDKIPVVYTSWEKPKVYMLVSSSGVVAAKFDISNIQKYRFSTYPLKGVKKAYEELKVGKAIFNKKFEGNEFMIREVALAYLDTDKISSFLQPVYVFRSDDNLAAYIPAVKSDYINLGKP